MKRYVSEAVIRRLPGYYRHLRELEAEGVQQISSQELGERMQLTPSQIRQDINCFGGFGRQGYGYSVGELKGHIAEILGLDRTHRMILVGTGNIGTAIANYAGFRRDGFETVAMFDADESKIGKTVAGIDVQDLNNLESYLAANPVDMAVLAVPVHAAQQTADRLVASGIKAIWNFAPTDINHREDVIVVNAHLTASIQILSYTMAHVED